MTAVKKYENCLQGFPAEFNKRQTRFNKQLLTASSKARSSLYIKTMASKVATKNIQAAGSSESPDNAITIPFIKTQDNINLLPKYSIAITRPKDDFLPAEDLDAVQLELELLLSTVAQRYRVLKSEYDAIEKEDRRDRKNKSIEKPPTSPGKRKRFDDKKTKDRFMPSFKMTKQRNSVSHSPAQSHHTDDSMDAIPHSSHHNPKDYSKSSIPKNDVPNKFWLSVEPYCMPITNEDLKLLDDILDQYSGPLVPPIPDLGPHYSTTWATDDLKDEQDNSDANIKSKARGHLTQNNDVNGIIKKEEKVMGEGVTGPLTQRLVSALIEENLMVDGLSNADSNSSSENTTNSSCTLRSISLMKNGISIEKRLKKELIEQGILDPDDFGKGQEDEILAEIKRVLAELSAIAEYNSTEIRRLHTAAKEELKRLEVKRKLDVVDQEIIEMYKKVLAAKQKRRQLSDQEKDEIYKLTEEQKLLSDQLDGMVIPGPIFSD